MYAYGPDSDADHDIDTDLLIDPDDDCALPAHLLWAPDPEDEDRPDAYTSVSRTDSQKNPRHTKVFWYN
ncbi:MAG: hypothetical protein ACR2OE_04050 [Thermomicrobiales bacterium]